VVLDSALCSPLCLAALYLKPSMALAQSTRSALEEHRWSCS